MLRLYSVVFALWIGDSGGFWAYNGAAEARNLLCEK